LQLLLIKTRFRYAGPGTQMVSLKFALGFDEYVSTNLSLVVVSIDGRGTGGRGLDYEKQT